MRSIQKIAVELKTGKKYSIKDLHEDFHTSSGILRANDFKKEKILSSTGKEFILLEPSLPDLELKRGPQVMIAKDIGLIIAKTGINKHSAVVDAGGGSGHLCLALANICKKVTVYEINPEHCDIVQKNIALAGMKNIALKQENVYKGIAEQELDLITLDLPEPWQAVTHAEKSLKEGAFLVVYLPNLTQVKMFTDSVRGTSFHIQETVELLERKWKIEERIMRPEFEMLGHTGFLTFCRKL